LELDNQGGKRPKCGKRILDLGWGLKGAAEKKPNPESNMKRKKNRKKKKATRGKEQEYTSWAQ